MDRQSARIETDRLFLRPLTGEDCTQTYLGWLNDPRINIFLETRHSEQSIRSITEFVESINANPAEHLFGIFLKSDLNHIGNIKIGPVLRHHPRADISLFIGSPASWGKGYASEAILGISRYAFAHLGVKKISASMYADNLGSYHAFLRVGYKHEGRRRDHAMINGMLQDILECGLVPQDLESMDISTDPKSGSWNIAAFRTIISGNEHNA